MGVYGTFLDAFTELFRTVTFWERFPRIGAGYEETQEQKMRVIVLTTSRANFQSKKITEYRALDTANHDILYCWPSTPVKQGMFLRHPDNGEVFTVDVALDFAFSGSFRAWGIDRVQGANSQNEQEIPLKEGKF